MTTTTDYDAQAEQFLTRNKLTFRADHKGDRCPPWCGEDGREHMHGDRYRVTIRRKGERFNRLSFDFWDSLAAMQSGEALRAYSVLACISGDVYAPETFEDFCDEYGYDTDSRKALKTFRRLRKFADKLQSFFTTEELEQMSEIV